MALGRGRGTGGGATAAAAEPQGSPVVDLLADEEDLKREVVPTVPTAQTVQPVRRAPAGRLLPVSVKVQVVMLGAMVELEYEACSVAQALAAIREEDPEAEFRTAFPAKGGFGSKETKLARVLVVGVRVSKSGKFIDLTSSAGGDDFKVSVGKNSADSFVADVEALGKLGARAIDKLKKAFEEKSEATVVLGEVEQFGVKYFTLGDSGRRFADSFVAEPPAEEAAHG